MKGKVTKEEALFRLQEHAAKIKSLDIKGAKLGELKDVSHEIEYDSEQKPTNLENGKKK